MTNGVVSRALRSLCVVLSFCLLDGVDARERSPFERRVEASARYRWGNLRGGPGDHLLTGARYGAVMDLLQGTARDRELHRVLDWQIVDYGVRGLEEQMAAFRRDCEDDSLRAAIDALYAQETERFDEVHVIAYKSSGGVPLELYVTKPENATTGERRGAILLLHGGGWHMGRPIWTLPMCRYFASRGLVAIGVQYRLVDRHGTTPIEGLLDAKSAVRWVRAHAAELGVDADRIAVGGWSAGGHLGTATAAIAGYEEPGEDPSVSSVPDALVLWFPAVAVTGDGWFASQVGGQGIAEALSPDRHVRAGLPPTIIFQGSDDPS